MDSEISLMTKVDAAYLYGLREGWNLGLHEDTDRMKRRQQSLMRQIKQMRRELRDCSEAEAGNQLQVFLGDEVCVFQSYSQWVNKAASWIGGRGSSIICVDSLGRICETGTQFMRARDDNSFPVRVFETVF